MWPLCSWLSHATGYGFEPEGGWPSLTSWILHGVLLQGLLPSANFDLNGPFWSLGLEWQFYFCFPLLAWAFHKFRPTSVIMLLIGITLVYRSMCIEILAGASTWVHWTVISSNIPGRIADFGIGMLAAWQLARGLVHPWSFQKAAAFFAFGMATAAAAVKTAPFSLFNDLLWAVAYYCLLMGAIGGVPWLGKVFSLRPLTWIGERSYSVYLVHLPLLVLISTPLMRRIVGIPLFVALIAILMPCAFALATLWYHLFERPFLRGAPSWWPFRRRMAELVSSTAQRLQAAHPDPLPSAEFPQ